MKLGCAVSTYPTKFGPIVFKDGKLDENFAMMREYGFTGVDLFCSKLTAEKKLEFRTTLEKHGVSMATFLAIFLSENGVKLSEKDPDKRLRNIDMVKEQLDNAAYFGASGLAMGFIRGGFDPEEGKEPALARIAEALLELGEYAHSIGTNILLEPINRYEINTLNSAVETADFVRDNKLKGVGLLIDAFHMNIEDKSIGDSIRYCKDYTINAHMADSNRYALGEGHLDMKEVVTALDETDFKGYLTLEAFANDPRETLAKTRKVLDDLTKETGIIFGQM